MSREITWVEAVSGRGPGSGRPGLRSWDQYWRRYPPPQKFARRRSVLQDSEAFAVAQHFRQPAGQLKAKGHGFGMDAVGATNHHGVAVFLGFVANRLDQILHMNHDHLEAIHQLQGQGRIEHVGAGHAQVNVAARHRPRIRSHWSERRSHRGAPLPQFPECAGGRNLPWP
jgi:hypothetical protein